MTSKDKKKVVHVTQEIRDGKHIYPWFLSQDSITFHSLALVEMEIVYIHIDQKNLDALAIEFQ